MVESNSAALIPPIIRNVRTGKAYRGGSFLGRDGYGSCYELRDLETNLSYAGKVIPKSDMTKLMRELLTQRTLTEPEIAYFVKEIAKANECLHNAQVIHRDIKLGNIFINEEMVPKVGDFGLSIALNNDKSLRFSDLGTPNYVASEVLTREGHSCGVDVWALGVIAYSLAVGRPPFEKESMKVTPKSELRKNNEQARLRYEVTIRKSLKNKNTRKGRLRWTPKYFY